MTGAGNQRLNVIRRGLSASGSGSGSVYGAGSSNGDGYSGASSSTGGSLGDSSKTGSGSAHMEGLTDEQKRALKRKAETLKSLEKDVERLKDERIRSATRRLDVEAMATVSALATFTQTSDWQRLSEHETNAHQPLSTPTRLTWEMIKKAVAEEEKYQSKKNWSSTKGRGNRRAPVARRLDADMLKRFGVYPALQFPVLATCDSCGRLVNAHFLREHQELRCTVSEAKRAGSGATGVAARGRKLSVSDGEETGSKRAASEAADEQPAGAKRAKGMSKKEQMRLEKEQRERERVERREQQRQDKERKKLEREAKRSRDQAKARQPVDLDRQCGVVAEPGALPCSRSLTCKTHSMAMKRAVLGRSKLFDALLQAHLAKSRSAAAAKSAASRSAAAGSAVRDALALALGDGAEDCSLDEDLPSDDEAERVIAAVACSRGRPLAVRPVLLPRRRHHYLRVRDLFFDALKPPMGAAEQPESLAT
ncbi:SAGA complex subunit Sgf73 [Coemansia sp. RSA 2607]|nr:SAGA complex subunit Sgf73 [Coemansia sp. RSA 2607]